jgi:hypothetical protein
MELNKPISHLTLCPSKKSITITKEPTAHKKASHQHKNKEDKVGKRRRMSSIQEPDA